MKCNQCDRPAMFLIGDKSNIPVCLNCYAQWKHTQDIDFLQNAMMMNQAMDDMDMVTGIHTGGGRMPVQALARAMQRWHTLNNFNISQSQIGVLNAGSIERIDAAITLSKGSDAELIGEQLKALTEAVIRSQELGDAQKGELLDLAETLAGEVVGKRKPATINALMKAIAEKVSGVAALAGAASALWQVLGPLVSG